MDPLTEFVIEADSAKRLLSRIEAADLIGRGDQLDRFLQIARQTGSPGIALLGAPSAGLSEFLRQLYDELFAGGGRIVPIYFEFRKTDLEARSAARRFFTETLRQTVARRRFGEHLLHSGIGVSEIADSAHLADVDWINRAIESFDLSNELSLSDFIRCAFDAPHRAAAHGVKLFVVVDAVETCLDLAGGEILWSVLRESFAHADFVRVFAGRRRFLFGRTGFETQHLSPLGSEDLKSFIRQVSRKFGVLTTDATVDLISIQLGPHLGNIKSLTASASATGRSLKTFAEVEQVYTDAIFSAGILNDLHDSTDYCGPENRLEIVKLLEAGRLNKHAVKYRDEALPIPAADLQYLLKRLNVAETLNYEAGTITVNPANLIAGDTIAALSEMEIEGKPRSLVVGRALANFTERAPRLMAREYRRNAALDLRSLIKSFQNQIISTALIDYGIFASRFRGTSNDQILAAPINDSETIQLPDIVYSANTETAYPGLAAVCDLERSAFGIRLSPAANLTAWIAAEIDSKLEATRETTEFWLDRLEMAALHCGFENFTMWLIAPEGFDEEARLALDERNAFGSSRRQADLIAQTLNLAPIEPARDESGKYKIDIPMSEDAELIAAHVIDDVGRRHGVATEFRNQMKTAVVEACINAAEHSLSPDRRIAMEFEINPSLIVIRITNRGIRLLDRPSSSQAEERRGWGLNLMRELMDEVTIEPTDDGTTLTMRKVLPPPESDTS